MSAPQQDEQDLARAVQVGLRKLLNLPADARIALLIDSPTLSASKDMPAVCVVEMSDERLLTLTNNVTGAHRYAESTAAHVIQLAQGKVRG